MTLSPVQPTTNEILKGLTNVELSFNDDTIIRNSDINGYLKYGEVLGANNNNTEVYNGQTVDKSSLWTMVRSDSKSESEPLKHMSVVRIRNFENKKFIRVNIR